MDFIFLFHYKKDFVKLKKKLNELGIKYTKSTNLEGFSLLPEKTDLEKVIFKVVSQKYKVKEEEMYFFDLMKKDFKFFWKTSLKGDLEKILEGGKGD